MKNKIILAVLSCFLATLTSQTVQTAARQQPLTRQQLLEIDLQFKQNEARALTDQAAILTAHAQQAARKAQQASSYERKERAQCGLCTGNDGTFIQVDCCGATYHDTCARELEQAGSTCRNTTHGHHPLRISRPSREQERKETAASLSCAMCHTPITDNNDVRFLPCQDTVHADCLEALRSSQSVLSCPTCTQILDFSNPGVHSNTPAIASARPRPEERKLAAAATQSCIVCTEDKRASEFVRITRCGHKDTCKACIERIGRENTQKQAENDAIGRRHTNAYTCPLCRADIDTVTILTSFNDVPPRPAAPRTPAPAAAIARPLAAPAAIPATRPLPLPRPFTPVGPRATNPAPSRSDEGESVSTGRECGICYDNKAISEFVLLEACGHSNYCKSCVDRVRSSTNKCPSCRAPITRTIALSAPPRGLPRATPTPATPRAPHVAVALSRRPAVVPVRPTPRALPMPVPVVDPVAIPAPTPALALPGWLQDRIRQVAPFIPWVSMYAALRILYKEKPAHNHAGFVALLWAGYALFKNSR